MTDRFGDVLDRVQRFADRMRDEFEMPGVQIALTDRSGLIGHIELGYANLEERQPVRPETIFQFGSIGKTFTAICLLQLESEGLVDLQAPFDTQLPWFAVRSAFDPMTTHHIMSHTSGLISGTDFTPEQRFEVWSLRNAETLTAPGASFHYSNVGFKALGLLIEHVTGKSYGQVVRERIFGPLGMRDVSESITLNDRSRQAVGYQATWDDRPRIKGHGVVASPFVETDSGDGSLCSSASDLAVFLRVFLNRGAYEGGRLLTDEQFERMMTNYDPAAEGDDGYGYGMAVPAGGAPGKFGHGGGMVGFISAMQGDLDSGFGAVALTNSMNDVDSIAQFALDALRAASEGQELPDPPEWTVPNLDGLGGTYYSHGGAITLRTDDDTLWVERNGDQAALTPVPNRSDRFVLDRPGDNLLPYRIEREESGAVARVINGEFEYVPEGIANPPAPDPVLARFNGHYRANNPWQPNFRIVARGDKLFRIMPAGYEHELVPEGDWYRGDSDEEAPERTAFDVFVEGVVVQCRDQMGSTWHRTFTP